MNKSDLKAGDTVLFQVPAGYSPQQGKNFLYGSIVDVPLNPELVKAGDSPMVSAYTIWHQPKANGPGAYYLVTRVFVEVED